MWIMDSYLKENCPVMHLIAGIIVVSPHGIVVHEREFSSLSIVKSRFRTHLQWLHLNAALRLHSESGLLKIFRRGADAWVETRKRWVSSTDRRWL